MPRCGAMTLVHEKVVITPYEDGPYLIRGPVELRDQNGRPMAS